MNTSAIPNSTRQLSSSRIAIIGLGLMGGSLAMALHGKCSALVGIDSDARACEFALQHGIVDEIADLNRACQCDVLVLATPVRSILDYLEQITTMAALHQPARIVIDLGSTKTEIVRAMQGLPDGFDPIGGHPMCGKEVNGIEHAESSLFQNKVFVLTPLERSSPVALDLAQEMLTAIGSNPLLLSAERHDRLTALVSHLPYVTACALMHTIQEQEDTQAWSLAASGFRDSTRLAASDLIMMLDILTSNREAILKALLDYRAGLDRLTTLIESGDEQGLRTALAPVMQQRSVMFR